MPIRMTISGADVKSTKIVKPGTYHWRIIKIEEALAGDKMSTNIVVDVVGLEGDAKDVPVKSWFTEKNIFAQHVLFVKATGGKCDEENGVDPAYDWEAQEGKVLQGKVRTDRGKDGNGLARNVIDEWYPPKGMFAAGAASTGSAAEAVGEFK